MIKKLEEIIKKQQGTDKGAVVFTLGEQIKEIAEKDNKACEIILNDIEVQGMKLSDVAAFFKKYADDNRKSQNVFCITPIKAEELIRNFYKIPETEVKEEKTSDFIDLSSFL